MSHVIGVDKGTTSTKVVVFNAKDGRVAGSAARDTRAFHPHVGWHEEDMEGTYLNVAACIAEAIADAGLSGADIAGVGVSGHMGGLWALDGAGAPLGRAIAWPDARASGVVSGWRDSGVLDEICDICGNAPIPGVPLALLAWLNDHDPDRLSGLKTLLFAKDYINFRLTGRVATDESDLSFFPGDIRRRGFSDRLLEIAGAERFAHALPEVLATGEIIGEVTPEAAELTGLRAGVPVVTGAGDAVAASLGAGCVQPGQAVTVIGTSFMNILTADKPLMEPAGVGFTFLMPNGAWQRLMANTGGGSLCLDWALKTFWSEKWTAAESDRSAVFAEVEAAVAGAPPLSGGVIAHPYLNTSGMSAPRFIPEARASLFGFDSGTSSAALLRSVMEGVAFSMVDCYAALDAEVSSIRLTGGGARSAIWCDICAAAMNRPLELPEVEETGALGVAMLAAAATGAHPTLEAAAAAMARVSRVVTPDPGLVGIYARGFPLFHDLGEALTPLWRERARLLNSHREDRT